MRNDDEAARSAAVEKRSSVKREGAVVSLLSS